MRWAGGCEPVQLNFKVGGHLYNLHTDDHNVRGGVAP
jgi:hypothetical protein